MSGARRREVLVVDAGSRPGRAPLMVLLVSCFILKLLVLWQLHDHPLFHPDAGLDTTAYAQLAHRVLAGDVGLGPGLYYVSPLYIYFLAASLRLLDSYVAIRIVQVLLGTASVACLFFTTRAWFGERAAWIAGVLATVTGLFTFYEILVLQSSIDGFLTSAALLCVTLALARDSAAGTDTAAATKDRRSREASRRDGWLYMTLAGVIFGVQTLNRPNVLVAALGIAVALFLTRRYRPSALLVAGLLTGMAPVGIRNAVVAHQWSFVSSHGGLNFYIGNAEGATGFYRVVPGIRPTIAGQEEDVRRVAERGMGRSLSDSEVSAYFYSRTWTWILDHPLEAAALFGKKLAFVLTARHIALPHSYPFYAYDERTLLRFLAVGPWLLVPLGLVGLVIARPRDRLAEYIAWGSFVPAYAISVAVFFVAERYRAPLLVPLSAGAGAALDRALSSPVWPSWLPPSGGRWWPWLPPSGGRSTGRTDPTGLATFSSLLAFVALFAFVNWPYKLQDGRWEEGLRLSQRLVILQRFDDADRWVERLEPRAPKPGAAHYGVGMQLLQQGETSRALVHLAAAQRLSPGDPHTEYGLGQALLRSGRAADALPHLRRGFDGGIELPHGGMDYVVALEQAGDPADALRAAQRVTPPDSEPESWLKLGRIAMQARQPETARPFFERAVSLRPTDAGAQLQFGLNLLVLRRYEEATRALAESVRLDPRNSDALSRLAYCEMQLGRLDQARAHAEAALLLAPEDALARQLLAALRRPPVPSSR